MRNSVASAFRRKIAFGRKIVVVTGVVMLAAAGVSAQTKPDADTEAIAKVRAAYQTAAGTQDGAALAKLYAPEGVEMPPNAPQVKGRAAIEAFHKAFGQQWMMHGMTITPKSVSVYRGDRNSAYEVGTYKQSLMPMKGGPVVDDVGKYVVLLQKDAASGNWLITHAIYNSDLPPPGAPAAKK
jgi:uncharacterized protein (TIGR02246 family)